jgi:HEPN domain-containing protein
MDYEEVKEWLRLADDDLDSARILNKSVRKHYAIICYHCAQAVEKYLKGYLVYNEIIPKKTHDLLFLNNLCIELDKDFEEIITECGYVNRFAKDIRYPHKYEIDESDVHYAINAVERVRDIKPVAALRKPRA